MKTLKMRITNLRRGRIARIGGLCAILLLLIYALHKWSNENVGISEEIVFSESQAGFYKSHLDVYPSLKTGMLISLCKLFYCSCWSCLND